MNAARMSFKRGVRALFKWGGVVLGEEIVRTQVPHYLPCALLAVLIYATWEILELKSVRGRLQSAYLQLHPKQKMLSYPIVFVAGGVLLCLYWLAINKTLAAFRPIQNHASTDQVPAATAAPTTIAPTKKAAMSPQSRAELIRLSEVAALCLNDLQWRDRSDERRQAEDKARQWIIDTEHAVRMNLGEPYVKRLTDTAEIPVPTPNIPLSDLWQQIYAMRQRLDDFLAEDSTQPSPTSLPKDSPSASAKPPFTGVALVPPPDSHEAMKKEIRDSICREIKEFITEGEELLARQYLRIHQDGEFQFSRWSKRCEEYLRYSLGEIAAKFFRSRAIVSNNPIGVTAALVGNTFNYERDVYDRTASCVMRLREILGKIETGEIKPS